MSRGVRDYFDTLYGDDPARTGRSGTSAQAVKEVILDVDTYDQLEQHLSNFLVSSELKVLRTVVKGGRWSLGVPSAIKRAVASDRTLLHAAGGVGRKEVMWVNLPYDRYHQPWSQRMVQRRVAEAVLGVGVAKQLVDAADEEDDYSGVKFKDRGLIRDVSRRISEELSQRPGGRFLLVMLNWWEGYCSPEWGNLGLPLPTQWSGFKVILWDPYSFRNEGGGAAVGLAPLGEPATNAYLSLNLPAMGDRLTYVYREAKDLADVLNSGGGDRDLTTNIVTPKDVLDCLIFTDFLPYFTLGRSKSPAKMWALSGLIASSSSSSSVQVETTAEAILDEVLRRRILLPHRDHKDGLRSLPDMLRWIIDFNASATPQGYEDFRPSKMVTLRWPQTLANLDQPENIQAVFVEGDETDVLLQRVPPGPLFAQSDHAGVVRFPDDSFSRMDSLRVLILVETKIVSLPSSIFGLPNLRILDLSDCKSLESLMAPGAPPPPSTRALRGLLFLGLNGTGIHSFPEEAFAHMHSLQVLLLYNCSNLNIEDENLSTFFTHMQTLQFLSLSSNKQIRSLPAQLLVGAPNLKRLFLYGCSALETLTPLLYSHPALEEVDLDFCKALQEEEIVFKSPVLKTFYLSECRAIRHLSFKGCSRLEVLELDKLEMLEVLDLSGTAVKELTPGTFKLPRLRRLLILGATQLRTLPWESMAHLPRELLRLDQHMFDASDFGGIDSDMAWQQDDSGGVQMHVRDGRFFRRLCDPKKGTYSKLRSLERFYIDVSPSLDRGRFREGHRDDPTPRVPPCYEGVRWLRPNILSEQHRLSRHVEIQVSHPSANDIFGFLENMLSLSVRNQHSYKSLSELVCMDTTLKQCQVVKCRQMKAVFECSTNRCPLESLETVWASQLTQVLAFIVAKSGINFNWSQRFKNLKHIHVEFCPKLRFMFPYGAQHSLQSLEVLEICFCSNLKEVFASPDQKSQPATSSSSSTLPFTQCLRIVQLLELPSLVSICHEVDTRWPALERFKVRGCRRLKKLPFPACNESNVAASSSSERGMVRVDGEREWWKRLVK